MVDLLTKRVSELTEQGERIDEEVAWVEADFEGRFADAVTAEQIWRQTQSVRWTIRKDGQRSLRQRSERRCAVCLL